MTTPCALTAGLAESAPPASRLRRCVSGSACARALPATRRRRMTGHARMSAGARRLLERERAVDLHRDLPRHHRVVELVAHDLAARHHGAVEHRAVEPLADVDVDGERRALAGPDLRAA